MRAALDLGADVVNDIAALGAPGALDVVAAHPRCGVCLMHMHGDAGDDARRGTLRRRRRRGSGVPARARSPLRKRPGSRAGGSSLDPGIGFGKTAEQNLALLARHEALGALGVPLVAGWSRKSTLARLAGVATPAPSARQQNACASTRRASSPRCSRSSAARASSASTTSRRRSPASPSGGPLAAPIIAPTLRAPERHEQNLLRNRRHPRHRRRGADHARLHAASRPCGRRGAARTGRRTPADGADRQGHPHLGLHDRIGAGGGVRVGGGRRRPHRPAADAGSRLPDAGAPPRSRRRHQRLAQPVRRQRDQVLLGARRKARRGVGARRRGRRRRRAALGRLGRARPRAPPRRRQRTLHRVLQEHLQQRADAARPEDRRRRSARCGVPRRARRLPRARRRSCRDRLQSGRVQHQRRVRRDRAAGTRRCGARRRRRLRHRARRRRRPAAGRRRGRDASTTATSCSTCWSPASSPGALPFRAWSAR